MKVHKILGGIKSGDATKLFGLVSRTSKDTAVR